MGRRFAVRRRNQKNTLQSVTRGDNDTTRVEIDGPLILHRKYLPSSFKK